MKKRIIYKKCIEVLEYTKAHNRHISPEVFEDICGEYTNAAYFDFKSRHIGNYIENYKSFWNINKKTIEEALILYTALYSEERKKTRNLIIAVIATISALISAVVGIISIIR